MVSTFYRSSPGLLSTSMYGRNTNAMAAKLSHGGGDSDRELFDKHDSDAAGGGGRAIAMIHGDHRKGDVPNGDTRAPRRALSQGQGQGGGARRDLRPPSGRPRHRETRPAVFHSDSRINYSYHKPAAQAEAVPPAGGGESAIAMIHDLHQHGDLHSDSNIDCNIDSNYHDAEGGGRAIALIHGHHRHPHGHPNGGRASREFPRGVSGERRSSQNRPVFVANGIGAPNSLSPRGSPTGGPPTAVSPAGPGRRLPSAPYARPPFTAPPFGPDVGSASVPRPPPPSILRRSRQRRPSRQQPQMHQQGRPLPPRRRCRFADEARGRPLATLHPTRPKTRPEDVHRFYYTEREIVEFQRQACLEAENGSAMSAAIAAAAEGTHLLGIDPRVSARPGHLPPQNAAVANGPRRSPHGGPVGQVRPATTAFQPPQPPCQMRMDAYRRACRAYSAIDASRARCQ